MAIITMPRGLRFYAASPGQARYDMAEMSDADGSSAARLFGPPRRRLSVHSHPQMKLGESSEWRSMILKLRGRVNHLAAHDPVHWKPRGTMRGTLTVSGAHSAGATALSITGGIGQAGTTLLQGDELQLGTGVGTSQVVTIVADATADGSGVVALTIEPPLRIAFANGVAVAWDHPLTYYKQMDDQQSWEQHRQPFDGHIEGGYVLDLLEDWTT